MYLATQHLDGRDPLDRWTAEPVLAVTTTGVGVVEGGLVNDLANHLCTLTRGFRAIIPWGADS
jgi:hypothetical protein